MIVNGREYKIEDLVKSIDFNKSSFKNIGGLMLTNAEIEILERNSVDYRMARSLKDLMVLIESILDDESLDGDDADDLEYVLREISERDYYEFGPKRN